MECSATKLCNLIGASAARMRDRGSTGTRTQTTAHVSEFIE